MSGILGPLAKNIADPGDAGAIVTREDVAKVNLVSGGAETRTIPSPIDDGQILIINMKTDGGDVVATAAAAVNAAGNNTLTFGAVTDVIVLLAVATGATFVWRVIGNDGVALSTV